MKKIYKSFLAGTFLSAMLAVSASAYNASFTNCADALNQMGLFQGTESGYALDKKPTRAEAATMLVRLLGKEAEAKEKNYTTPFTDVPDWAKPYVGWLYENKLTNGTTNTTYGSNSDCTSQMYATFLLRTLGYSDTGSNADFNYKNAIDFAMDKNVLDYANYDEDSFLRDNLVAMSYTALATNPKDDNTKTLLDKLVADGAIDSAKAKPVQDTFNTYNEYSKLVEKNQSITDMDMNINMDINAKMNNVQALSMKVDGNMKANMNLKEMDKSKFAMNAKADLTVNKLLTGEEKDTNETVNMNLYYADGMYYINVDNEKMKMPLSFEDIMDGMDITDMTSNYEPISMLQSISKNSDGSFNVSYTSGYLNSMVETALGMSLGEITNGVDMSFDKVNIVVKSQNDQIKNMKADMSFTVKEPTTNTNLVFDIGVGYDIVATGDSVNVTLPTDLDTYQDMSFDEDVNS